MEALAPIFFACVLPMVWTGIVFLLGRWSASHTFRIERRGQQAGPVPTNSPYYEDFEEERPYAG